ncbi:DUF7660 family protein [Pseudomonas entomophila]|uniref:DUF7660 family protein n=1 Tax=Pseudomonas entomophila TaxID=312306 RepID=UPI001F01DBFD|nr:hypothetical protein [Pseudomonas entomophila]MCG8294105.1 hypothetical protein [Pseudomonas entomophila]
MFEDIYPIESKSDLVKLICALVKNLRENPEEWENGDLLSYLEAMAAWVEDMDGYYKNTNQVVPEASALKAFADMLMAARIYE